VPFPPVAKYDNVLIPVSITSNIVTVFVMRAGVLLLDIVYVPVSTGPELFMRIYRLEYGEVLVQVIRGVGLLPSKKVRPGV
jgi:hypothetical protein